MPDWNLWESTLWTNGRRLLLFVFEDSVSSSVRSETGLRECSWTENSWPSMSSMTNGARDSASRWWVGSVRGWFLRASEFALDCPGLYPSVFSSSSMLSSSGVKLNEGSLCLLVDWG